MAVKLETAQSVNSLFSTNAYDSDYQQSENPIGSGVNVNLERDKVQYKYPVKGENCYALDKNIKDITEEILTETKNILANKGSLKYLKELKLRKGTYELSFSQGRCSDRIEEDRQKETANLITKAVIEQEKAVLKPANIEQRVYIGVGALILLVGLYIVVKK